MLARAISQSVLYSPVLAGALSPAHALTQQKLVAKLESAGYSQIRDIKSTAEGTAVKSRSDARESHYVQEQRIGPQEPLILPRAMRHAPVLRATAP